MRLIVTRPETEAERTAAALRALGHAAEIAPLMCIETVADAALGPGPWSALLITSANAVKAAHAHARREELFGLRVFAVGARTAAAASAAGFRDVAVGGANVAELTQRVRAWGQQKGAERGARHPLLYLAGEDRSRDLAAELSGAGETVHTVTVYRAVKAERFPPALAAALTAGEIGGALHFSRRSAEAYLDCARAAALLDCALRVAHYCLSAEVAVPLSAAGARDVRIAPRPEEAALMVLIGPAP